MSSTDSSPEFEALLDYLKHSQSCDLTSYKRSTLMRQFKYRMRRLGIESYQNYLQHLQCHAEERLALLQDVFINFTGFFRNPDAWIYLATEVIPQLIASKPLTEPIRVWSAGCSTGQEIYSFLILVSEVLGTEFCLQHLQCYATDVDEGALQKAQKAHYSHLEVRGILPELLEKYFQQTEQGYVFHPDLHRLVQFRQHDLMQHAPIPKIDLLICRNALMYFTGEAQASVLARFHCALKNTGFLFLGKVETLTNRREIFRAVHLRHQIYTKGMELSLEDYRSIFPKLNQKQAIQPLIPQNYF